MNIKKYIISALVGLGLAFGVNAATTTLTITNGTMTNVTSLINGSLKVTQFVLTSSGTNYGTVSIYDTYTNKFLYTNAAYTNILTYATNYISVWTNYYGVTNTVTNSGSLIDVTNLVSGTTNSFPLRAVISTGTNASTTVNNPGIYFNDGIWVTNGSGSVLSLVVTYQQ